jgi:hypothetical protein
MPGHDNKNWTLGAGKLGTRAMEQGSWDEQMGQDRGTGQAGQDKTTSGDRSQDSTARKGNKTGGRMAIT